MNLVWKSKGSSIWNSIEKMEHGGIYVRRVWVELSITQLGQRSEMRDGGAISHVWTRIISRVYCVLVLVSCLVVVLCYAVAWSLGVGFVGSLRHLTIYVKGALCNMLAGGLYLRVVVNSGLKSWICKWMAI